MKADAQKEAMQLMIEIRDVETIEIMDTAMMIIMEEDMNKQVVVTMEGMSRVDPEAVTEKHIGHAATTEETRGLATQTTGRIKDSGHDIRTKENGSVWSVESLTTMLMRDVLVVDRFRTSATIVP
jgi:cell fate (sporulation/competence/biofilm development) regulator YmcA (YheA/YmcA/DUF963 family)